MLISNLKEELLDLIKNDSEIADAIKDVLADNGCILPNSNINDDLLKMKISNLEARIEAETKERELVENESKKMKNKIVEMQKIVDSKDAEYQKLKEKYTNCKEKHDVMVEKYNDIKLRYSELDMIYSKYLSLGDAVIEKLERVLNNGINTCNSPELFLSYGIQESNIVALWESIAINLDFYNSEGKTRILIDIFEYFIKLYKEVTYKSVTINIPDEGEKYDERFHTRTVSSNAVGKIQEIILPGFSIGKNINKKALVTVK